MAGGGGRKLCPLPNQYWYRHGHSFGGDGVDVWVALRFSRVTKMSLLWRWHARGAGVRIVKALEQPITSDIGWVVGWRTLRWASSDLGVQIFRQQQREREREREREKKSLKLCFSHITKTSCLIRFFFVCGGGGEKKVSNQYGNKFPPLISSSVLFFFFFFQVIPDQYTGRPQLQPHRGIVKVKFSTQSQICMKSI